MKRFLLPALLTAGLFLTASVYGQEVVQIDKQFGIQLTEAQLDAQSVQIDISNLIFRDETMAQKFFRSIENNLVTYALDYDAKTVVMTLHPERLGKHTWTLENWNNYLATAASNSAATYQSFENQ